MFRVRPLRLSGQTVDLAIAEECKRVVVFRFADELEGGDDERQLWRELCEQADFTIELSRVRFVHREAEDEVAVNLKRPRPSSLNGPDVIDTELREPSRKELPDGSFVKEGPLL